MLNKSVAVGQESWILEGSLEYTMHALSSPFRWAWLGRRYVSAALTITNIHSVSQCLLNIARGAEHTVAGCRYQCDQGPAVAGVPSAAPGLRLRSSIVHFVSLHLLGAWMWQARLVPREGSENEYSKRKSDCGKGSKQKGNDGTPSEYMTRRGSRL